ncbi:MAG: hypothetical protein CMG46_11625 [Candidatus Marinimicrobia bacterium]|nr:hypothetical protein [Candidatus Neomarinimicrobiota bacterium]
MKSAWFISTAAAALFLAFASAFFHLQAQEAKPSKDWLLEAPDDTTRFQLLQRYLRGFDQPMWEVGHRYLGIYDALSRENYDLALYNWDKIKTTIQNGYLKRPARRANAESMFLTATWGEVREDFKSRNKKRAWDGFFKARSACLACHVAEDVAWMNDQNIFQDTASSKN